MPRKRRSFGSITEVIKGKKYICRWVENTEEGRKRRSKTVHGTYKDTERFLAQKNLEVGEDRRAPTFEEAYRLWYLPWMERRIVKKKIGEDTKKLYTAVWNKEIAPRFSKKAMDKVSALDMQKWLLSLAPATASRALTMLRQMASDAMKYVKMPDCPVFLDYEMPDMKTKEKTRQVYTRNESIELFGMLNGNRMFEAPFIMARFGGARVSEALAVTAGDVEIRKRGGVSVACVITDKQMEHVGAVAKDSLKNEQSKRVSIIPEPYCFRLMEIADQRRTEGMEHLCDRGDGLPLNASMLNYYWKRLDKGDVPTLPFSNLRKAWRTEMEVDYKVPYPICELLMGHKLDGVTGRHYFTPSLEQMIDAVCEGIRIFRDMK